MKLRVALHANDGKVDGSIYLWRKDSVVEQMLKLCRYLL